MVVMVTLQDRAMQTRILDLESQLSQTRAEIARVKREKEEVSQYSLMVRLTLPDKQPQVRCLLHIRSSHCDGYRYIFLLR